MHSMKLIRRRTLIKVGLQPPDDPYSERQYSLYMHPNAVLPTYRVYSPLLALWIGWAVGCSYSSRNSEVDHDSMGNRQVTARVAKGEPGRYSMRIITLRIIEYTVNLRLLRFTILCAPGSLQAP